MFKKYFSLVFIMVLIVSCQEPPERNCKDFKNGKFTFTSTIDGEETTTTFTRNNILEVDYYNKRIDSSSVRWINDCEYVVKKLNPTNTAEEKSIHMKILSTTESSYTFEYAIVGESQKIRGTATKAD